MLLLTVRRVLGVPMRVFVQRMVSTVLPALMGDLKARLASAFKEQSTNRADIMRNRAQVNKEIAKALEQRTATEARAQRDDEEAKFARVVYDTLINFYEVRVGFFVSFALKELRAPCGCLHRVGGGVVALTVRDFGFFCPCLHRSWSATLASCGSWTWCTRR